MLTLFTDTDCDITPEVAKEYGYKLISMPYIIDEKEIYPYVDYEKFDEHKFYQSLRDGVLPTTCGLSAETYKNYFEPEFEGGNDILYVHFSRAMTGTFEAMDEAVAELQKKYPDRKFYQIDTKAITILSYMIVTEIGKLYASGKTAEEICEWAKENVDKFAVFFYANHLNFFKRSGRVSGFSATMGQILSIHPILTMSSDGIMTTISKRNGKRNTMKKILDFVEEVGDDFKNHRIVIGHSDCLPLAKELVNMLKERFGNDLEIEYVSVNPTAGSHCGPDCIGICVKSTRR